MNGLGKHNQELLDKKKVLAISKSDLLDDELIDEIKSDLPAVTSVFISSITGYQLDVLKDLLWNTLNE